jgi:hypothetical protein
VRLRRAERSSAARGDIVAVRTDLERTIGPTVSRAMAARLLNVSQTALDRWITTGDVPVVLTPGGRHEVPLHVLTQLLESVADRHESGADRHPLASVLRRRRAESGRLDSSALLSNQDLQGLERSHRSAELRGLAYHRAVAQRLDEDLVHDARSRVERWMTDGAVDSSYAQAWLEVLSLPLSQIGDLIGQDSEQMRDLRQSSPLAGVLTEPERRRVLAAVEETLA